jgi:sensor histidine kinase YesM
MAAPKKILLGISILAIFVFMVSGVSLYVQNLMAQNMLCGCIIPIYMIIPLLSSVGVFIGTFVYYLMMERAEKTEKGLKQNMEKTLVFLQRGEREVLKKLIESGGQTTQASLSRNTDLGKVQVFRIVEKLKVRGVIEKESHGKTNVIRLSKELQGLFVRERV